MSANRLFSVSISILLLALGAAFNRLCGRIEVPAVTVSGSSGQATELVGRACMVTRQYFRWLLER